MPILIALAITAILVLSMGACCECEDAPEAAAVEEVEALEEAPAEEPEEEKENDDAE